MIRRHDNEKGFTLLELLIVIALIGTLVSIAVPAFGGKINEAKITTDQANVRNAQAAAIAQYMAAGGAGSRTYYFNAGTGMAQEDPASPAISGYGQYDKNDKADVIGASGTPNQGGEAGYVKVAISDNGSVSMSWANGLPYTGRTVMEAASYAVMSTAQRIQLDQILLDSITAKLQSMTYREIIDLFFYQKDGKYYLKDAGLNKEVWGGRTCLTLAASFINNDNSVNASKNAIYSPELFQAIGYDMNADGSPSYGSYIITSVEDGYSEKSKKPAYVKVDLGREVVVGNNKDGFTLSSNVTSKLDGKATGAYAYVNGGNGEHYQFLTHEYRKPNCKDNKGHDWQATGATAESLDGTGTVHEYACSKCGGRKYA